MMVFFVAVFVFLHVIFAYCCHLTWMLYELEFVVDSMQKAGDKPLHRCREALLGRQSLLCLSALPPP